MTILDAMDEAACKADDRFKREFTKIERCEILRAALRARREHLDKALQQFEGVCR